MGNQAEIYMLRRCIIFLIVFINYVSLDLVYALP